MPSNRRRLVKPMTPPISDSLRQYLEFGKRTPDDLETFWLAGSLDRLRRVWRQVKKEILADWIQRAPCTRPWTWWRHDAPAPRRRLGGIGTPASEVLAVDDFLEFGIPVRWITPFLADYYNGRAKDIHGNIIPTPYKPGDFTGVPIDASNPPAFESQASFLERHRLLAPVETKHLAAHPALLEPEVVLPCEDDNGR